MESVREQLQIFTRRFGLLNASCCETCCGAQVSLVQSHILFEVRRAGNPAMQQVADELGMDITTFSRQIKTLESRGLVTKSPSGNDRRVNLLNLTAEGSQILAQIDSFMETKIENIFASMTPFERNTVINSLQLLNEAAAKASCC